MAVFPGRSPDGSRLALGDHHQGNASRFAQDLFPRKTFPDRLNRMYRRVQRSIKPAHAGNLEQVLKASSAIPIFYRGYPEVEGRPMTDGGVTDAIPIAEAIRSGARHIMVIRSRRRNYLKVHGPFDFLLQWRLRDRPLLREALAARVQRYNKAVALIRRPPKGISIVEICPPEKFRVSRLSRNLQILQEDRARSSPC